MSQSDDLPVRLDALHPQIEELMKIAGTAGASLGIHQDGKPRYYANFGFRNVQDQLPTSETTIFPICSLTKLFTALSMGTIVDNKDNGVGWNTRIKDILPDFNISDDILRDHMTISDSLSHQTGMSASDFYLGSENNIIIAKKDSLEFLSDQVPVSPFRQRWSYNNLGYELTGLAIDKILSPKSWSDVIHENFLSSLNMTRTYTRSPPTEAENISKAYNVVGGGTPTEIPTVKAGDGSFGGASGGMFSCVRDLTTFYAAVMEAMDDQFTNNRTQTEGSPFKQVPEILSAKIPMNSPTYAESSYAFGAARLQLPGQMGYIGFNPGLMPGGMPIVARGTAPRLILYHQGSLPGALSCVVMIPSLKMVLVVASNTLGLNDCPDWIVQLLLEELLEAPERNDYIGAARLSAASTLQWYDTTVKALRDDQTAGTVPSRPLGDYVGTYWNKKGYISIDVSLEGGKLSWAIQGLDFEKFELDHYQDDTFTWIKPRDYMAARGRWVDNPPVFWKIVFANGQEGIVSLNWVHDPDAPWGEEFFKD